MPIPAETDATIAGVLERITFQDEKSGYTVARLQESGRQDPATIVGPLAGIAVGSALEIDGFWRRDPKYGMQFTVKQWRLMKPNTLRGLEKYLGSGLIKGIGTRYAARIVKHFGLDTLDILDQEPERLIEVEGLGAKRAAKIKDAWIDQRAIHMIMVFLQGHGISAAYAVKIYKTYGAKAMTVVKENPYRLAEDIWGIGFKIADRIAQSLGMPSEDPRRARAGLLYALQQASEGGHCLVPLHQLAAKAQELLDIPAATIEKQMPALVLEEKIMVEEEAVYLPFLYHAEKGTSRRLTTLATPSIPAFGDIDAPAATAWAARQIGITFAPEQEAAIKAALGNKVTIITGGPGTGKSTLLRALILILDQKKVRIRLAAPTGRAAKRLGEATGREAVTIHRLLEYAPSHHGFKHNEDTPLEGDLFVIDEASMLDIVLAYSLIRAIPPAASLVLVGDIDQLPSVGPGNVLRDIIAAERFAVIRLERIFRQGTGSLISTNAALINRGAPLELLPNYNGDKDFYCIYREEADAIATEIVSLCTSRLRTKYGFDPIADIQVLAPTRRGAAGTINLNALLQEALNPDRSCAIPGVRDTSSVQSAGRPALERGGIRFCVGDKVMQLKNNYDKEVFNGDMGIIAKADNEEHNLIVTFDNRQITYEASELNELELAYAITVHKSQGSEFPCVIMPIHTTHYPLLQRNLLYTGVTRGKKLVILIGSRKAINMAIKNNLVQARNTRLRERIILQ